MPVKINENAKFSDDAFMDRFARHITIPGWGIEEQKKIFNKRILILGNNALGEMTLAGLASFGARNLFYQDYRDNSSPKSYFSNVKRPGTRLERIIKTVSSINPHAKMYGYKAPFTKLYINLENFVPEIVIDTTNNTESKEEVLDYLDHNRGIKLISGVSNENSCAVSFYDPSKENQEKILDDILNPKIDLDPEVQGGFTSTIAAGFIIEEFRKSIFSLRENDKNSEDTVYYDQNSPDRNSPVRINSPASTNSLKDQSILVAGCGGIGTYIGLGLAQEGFSRIFFLDMDKVEETNLNRQMLFYDDLGLNKSSSLSKKLQEAYGIRSTALFGKIDGNSKEFFKKHHFDLIFGGFDNINARFNLNGYAIESGTPYIDGATSYKSGQIVSYIPGKTLCIKCKKGLHLEEESKGNSCDDSPPSVISPNMIIGSMIVGEAIKYFSGDYQGIDLSYHTETNKKITASENGHLSKKDCVCSYTKNERT